MTIEDDPPPEYLKKIREDNEARRHLPIVDEMPAPAPDKFLKLLQELERKERKERGST